MLFQDWGSTPDEVEGVVVGDDLLPDARVVATRSIDLSAAPAEVFPWLVQMGFGRAGWYSYDWIDNLGRRSARRIHPEWQDLAQGDPIPGGPIAFEASVVEPPHGFVMSYLDKLLPLHRIHFVLAFDLRAKGAGTRLVTRASIRIDGPLGRFIERFVLGPGDGVMVRKQLLNLAERTR